LADEDSTGVSQTFDVVVVGAGAAGLMCALRAGQRGRKVLLLEHAEKVGKKILISGGGRCNFTNLEARPDAFLSANPHFCKSALARYTQHDFITLVEKHRIDLAREDAGAAVLRRLGAQIVACCWRSARRRVWTCAWITAPVDREGDRFAVGDRTR
jgi:predicted flavoprotein YhiN